MSAEHSRTKKLFTARSPKQFARTSFPKFTLWEWFGTDRLDSRWYGLTALLQLDQYKMLLFFAGFTAEIPLTQLNSEVSYQLRIYYTNEDRYLNLNFPATKTLIEIKNDLNAVLKIPVRFQKWEGWPSNVTNSTKLSDMGIEQIHLLQLTCMSSDSSSSTRPNFHAA